MEKASKGQGRLGGDGERVREVGRRGGEGREERDAFIF